MAHGGSRAPDGRPPVAPGVGKTARRHDLEKPKTPGIGGPATGPTDLQQGDVQRLEQAEKAVPATRGQQPTGGKQADTNVRSTGGGIEVPDAIDFAGQRTGQNIGAQGQGGLVLDRAQWLPLLQEIAKHPKRSGPLAAALLAQLSNISDTPSAGRVGVIDENAIQDAILRSVS